MMKRNFEEWLATFKDTVADWGYYTDFEKVYRNVNEIKIELNLLNSLINSKDIINEFRNLVKEYPNVLKAIPILLAKRSNEIVVNTPQKVIYFDFININYSVEEYIIFMEKSGLFDLLSNHIISDLTDYVKGVEVGLDSNARKNRTGKTMQKLVENFIVEMGFCKGINYFSEMNATEIEEKFDVDLSKLTNDENRANKRFDFVVSSNGKIFAIEVNFYSSGGSKLNETARSYKSIAQDIKDIEGVEFVWITDGGGWNYAKANLKETYVEMDNIFNLNDLENGKLKDLLK